jgi:hypothetical protein
VHSPPAGPDYYLDGLMESLKQLQSKKLKCADLILYTILKRGKNIYDPVLFTLALCKNLFCKWTLQESISKNGPKSLAPVGMVLTAKGVYCGVTYPDVTAGPTLTVTALWYVPSVL